MYDTVLSVYVLVGMAQFLTFAVAYNASSLSTTECYRIAVLDRLCVVWWRLQRIPYRYDDGYEMTPGSGDVCNLLLRLRSLPLSLR
jgi:hypothetical protein